MSPRSQASGAQLVALASLSGLLSGCPADRPKKGSEPEPAHSEMPQVPTGLTPEPSELPAPPTGPEIFSGDALDIFMPKTLGGGTERGRIEGAFGRGRSYATPAGEFISLDLQAVQDPALAHKLASHCDPVEFAAHPACLSPGAEKHSATWLFSDRLRLILSAPSEAVLASAAAELPLDAIAELAARPAP